jgi:hypothetical protein
MHTRRPAFTWLGRSCTQISSNTAIASRSLLGKASQTPARQSHHENEPLDVAAKPRSLANTTKRHPAAYSRKAALLDADEPN